MSTDPGLRHRFRYRLDNLLARGTWAALLCLGIVTFLAALLSSLLLRLFGVTFTGDDGGDWRQEFWPSFVRMMDPGTMADDVGPGRRVLALVITVFGLLVAGTLIGIMANGVEDRIARLRRGRSLVIESGHVVVLGSSPRLPAVVRQLVLASADRGGAVIVVLTEDDPAEIHDAVKEEVDDLMGSRIVYRAGDPTKPADLELLRLEEARTAVVLGVAGDETRAVMTVLAIGATLDGFDGLPVVVEVEDPETSGRLLRACGRGVHPMVPTQTIARTASYAMRARGISQVLGELLDAEGPDIQVRDEPDLVGVPFADIVTRWANARPIGRVRPDGEVELNPAPDTRFDPGDHLVVVRDDGDPMALSVEAPRSATPTDDRPDDGGTEADDHIVVVGWNPLGAHLLAHWAATASARATAEIVHDATADASAIDVPGLDRDRLILTPRNLGQGVGFTTDPTDLSTVVLLARPEATDGDAADSSTLLDLLAIRREVEEAGGHPRFVVELTDAGNDRLAQAGPEDHLVSQAIAAQFIAQLAEQPERRAVYLDLYGPSESSIALVPAEDLGLTGPRQAADVIGTAFAAGLLAIGWRRAHHGGELTLNPHGAATVDLAADDEIVVIG